jgi:Holliday junction resolvase RusA-like endonuclease
MYAGRRYKTDRYRRWITGALLMMPPADLPAGCKLGIDVSFYVSTEMIDLDNCLKSLIDTLEKKYGFNDRRVYTISARKIVVQKGQEKIDYLIRRI